MRIGMLARVSIVGILLLAFALRIYRLGDQSLWFDEAGSIYWATNGIAGLTGDFNPPVYYALLSLWIQVTGISEFALRYLSLIPAVASVALLFAVVRRASTVPVALGSALVLATSPFSVYYGQEARMYSLVLFLSLLLVWLVPKAARDARAAAAYAAVAAAGMLTHYFFIVPFALCTAWWLIALLRQRGTGSFARFLVANAAAGVVCLPWFVYILGRAIARNDFWRVQLPPNEIALDLVRSFAFGEAWLEHFDQSWLITVAVVLGLSGLGWRRSRIAVSAALVGLVAAWALVAFAPQPIYTARYLIVVLPAFAVLIAGGLGAVPVKGGTPGELAGGALAVAAFAIVLTAMHGPALQTLYFDTRYQRDDYRTLAQRMEPIAREDDPMVYLAGRMDLPFRYYFGGAGIDLILDDTRRYAPGERSPALQQLLADPELDRVWLIRSIAAADFINDPDRTVPATFHEAGATRTADIAVKGLVADLYEKPSWRGREVAASVGAFFGDWLVLDAVLVEPHPDGSTVALYWEAVAPNAQPLAFSVQALGEGGLVAQQDGMVGGQFAEVLTRPGGRQRDVVTLDLTTIDQPIEIAVAVYDPATGQRLPTAGDYEFSPNLKRVEVLLPSP